MNLPPIERLRARIALLGAPLCLGIDPDPSQLPAELPRTLEGVEIFARGIIQAAGPEAAAIKINPAFFEAYGSAGWAALERVRAAIPGDQVVIVDAKRGDIATTAERYATGIFDHLGADGVTLSPYLGEDGIAPFHARAERLLYVLARTSNPSAATLQGLQVAGLPLYLHVAEWVAERWPEPRVGLVVGATAPSELELVRGACPGPAFLVPGVGAQGGDLDAAVRFCHGEMAPGLVAVSRAIAAATSGTDWQEAASAAARALSARMQVAGATLEA